MPLAQVRGININYRILGKAGPWVALNPGGRRGMDGVETLAQRVADAGFRVVMHDRRNCGASDVSIAGEGSEYEIWADDLHALLTQLKAQPAYVGGSSSGCRMSIVYALRHPVGLSGLLLWRVTGGGRAARRLAKRYYGDLIELAQQGGMAAVCESKHFKECIEHRPENRQLLMAMDAQRFIQTMSRWNEYFVRGADQPVIGISEEELKSIAAPIFVVPGNDLSHPPEVAERLTQLAPKAVFHPLVTKVYDLDVGPRHEWGDKEAELAALFVEFMKGEEARAAR